MLISAGEEAKAELTYIPLLFGRTVKGTTFGGVRIHSDLPKIVEKCINKVNCLKILISSKFSTFVACVVRVFLLAGNRP